MSKEQHAQAASSAQRSPSGFRKSMAEFLGTFALVFFGTGAMVINAETGGAVSHIGIALTFGGIVMAMIYSFGEISGAHINPAVTIAFWASGKFRTGLVLPYIISQTAGAILASGLLKILFPDDKALGATYPLNSTEQAFGLEIILTFFLMLVIIHVATGSKEQGLMAGIAIGAMVLISAAFAGPISGASMNPARSLGPALINGDLSVIWIYLTAPVIGAVLAVGAWRTLKT